MKKLIATLAALVAVGSTLTACEVGKKDLTFRVDCEDCRATIKVYSRGDKKFEGNVRISTSSPWTYSLEDDRRNAGALLEAEITSYAANSDPTATCKATVKNYGDIGADTIKSTGSLYCNNRRS